MTPRGIRNHNPGNIERNKTRWVGMAESQPDPRFITFIAPEYGIRAMARILLGDYRAGKLTIFELITEWAPPVENDTESYVRAVGKACDVNPYAPCDIQVLLPKIIAAIIKHENGEQPYDMATIERGIALERT